VLCYHHYHVVLFFIIIIDSKIQIGFTFLVPAHLGSPGKRAVKQVCVCVYRQLKRDLFRKIFLDSQQKMKWKMQVSCLKRFCRHGDVLK